MPRSKLMNNIYKLPLLLQGTLRGLLPFYGNFSQCHLIELQLSDKNIQGNSLTATLKKITKHQKVNLGTGFATHGCLSETY